MPLKKPSLKPNEIAIYDEALIYTRGASPTQVAETCGTSTAQIEKTYYHTTERKMIENAMPQYYYKDGLLIPK